MTTHSAAPDAVPAPVEPRLAYDDSVALRLLGSDAGRCGARLRRAAARATGPAPSIRFEDQPREVAKREITVSQAARRLADSLQLHLD